VSQNKKKKKEEKTKRETDLYLGWWDLWTSERFSL